MPSFLWSGPHGTCVVLRCGVLGFGVWTGALGASPPLSGTCGRVRALRVFDFDALDFLGLHVAQDGWEG